MYCSTFIQLDNRDADVDPSQKAANRIAAPDNKIPEPRQVESLLEIPLLTLSQE
jgi:hypothetical protein